MNNTVIQQFVAGLKSRSDETRLQAAKDLRRYALFELQELSRDDLSRFLDEFDKHLTDMVTNGDISEKKGAVMALSKFQRRFRLLDCLICSNDFVVLQFAIKYLPYRLLSRLFAKQLNINVFSFQKMSSSGRFYRWFSFGEKKNALRRDAGFSLWSIDWLIALSVACWLDQWVVRLIDWLIDWLISALLIYSSPVDGNFFQNVSSYPKLSKKKSVSSPVERKIFLFSC